MIPEKGHPQNILKQPREPELYNGYLDTERCQTKKGAPGKGRLNQLALLSAKKKTDCAQATVVARYKKPHALPRSYTESGGDCY